MIDACRRINPINPSSGAICWHTFLLFPLYTNICIIFDWLFYNGDRSYIVLLQNIKTAIPKLNNANIQFDVSEHDITYIFLPTKFLIKISKISYLSLRNNLHTFSFNQFVSNNSFTNWAIINKISRRRFVSLNC